MFKRMIATLLAGAMFITATPIDSLQGFLQDVESVTEAEEQAADSQTEEDLVEDDTGGSGRCVGKIHGIYRAGRIGCVHEAARKGRSRKPVR